MSAIRVEVGTYWRDQWNRIRVRVVALGDGADREVVEVEDVATGERKRYANVRRFLDVYVSD